MVWGLMGGQMKKVVEQDTRDSYALIFCVKTRLEPTHRVIRFLYAAPLPTFIIFHDTHTYTNTHQHMQA